MSSKNNVNPDHYKVAGGERMGEDVGQDMDKRRLAMDNARARHERKMKRRQPVG